MTAPRIHTAFLPGAGLGMRLRPLTESCPKPLLPLGGRPIITYAMDHLLTVGVERFIVNTHHCADVYEWAFPDRQWRGIPIVLRHEPVLLDTAGGLKNIEDLLQNDARILVYNADILTNLPLMRLLEAHAAQGREATLALRGDGPLCNVDLDRDGRICDMRRLLNRPGVKSCLLSGIYIVEKPFLRRLTVGAVESVVPVFVRMIAEKTGSVACVLIDAGEWHDIGTLEEYQSMRNRPPAEIGMFDAKPAASRNAVSPPPEVEADGISFRQPASHPERPKEGGQPAPAPLPSAAPTSASTPAQKSMSAHGAFQARPEHNEQAQAFADVADDVVRSYACHVLKCEETRVTEVTFLAKGGSDRSFRRIRFRGAPSVIVMHYNSKREENRYYATIADFLQEIGVAVPKIFHFDRMRCFILMQDLGDADLWSFRLSPWSFRRDHYRKVLGMIHRLHSFPLHALDRRSVRLMPAFGPELYRWERDYFHENLVRGVCGIELDVEDAAVLEVELAGLAERLEQTEPRLVHRDFQSQNIMIDGGAPVIIDFQGLRVGSYFYDLGSLLYDPYVPIHEHERMELLRYYYDLQERDGQWEAFEQSFREASVQRLMQALGAFGFLGQRRNRKDFLAHVPNGLQRLSEAASRCPRLTAIRRLSARCLDALPDHAEKTMSPSS
jgi:aminoglycoside/choline kinase family phosphotransferase/choline kinase